MKDTWTKQKGVGSRVGSADAWGGEVGRGKWRQLYLNNNKNVKNKSTKATFFLLMNNNQVCVHT